MDTKMIVRINKLLFVAGILLISSFLFFVKAEEDLTVLNSSDQKKLDKAGKLEQQAADVNKEADDLFAKSASVSVSSDASDAEKLNNKAIEKQIEALKLTDKAQRIIFEVYLQKLNKYAAGYNGNTADLDRIKNQQESAQQSFQNATGQVEEASTFNDNLVQYSRLSSAVDQEKTAVSNLKSTFESIGSPATSVAQPVEQPSTTLSQSSSDSMVLSAPSLPTPPVVIAPPDVTVPGPSVAASEPAQTTPIPSNVSQDTSKNNIYKAVRVNEDMVDIFNKFLSEKYPSNYQDYLFDFNSLDYSNLEAVRNAWYQYLYGPDYANNVESTDSASTKAAADSLKLLAQADSIRKDSIAKASMQTSTEQALLAQADNKKANTKGSKKKTKAGKKQKEQVISEDLSATSTSSFETSTGKSTTKPRKVLKPKFNDTTEFITSGFTYQVQIAACRAQLSPAYLSYIYKGGEKPVETTEDNWYKYSVGTFMSYKSARRFRDNCGVHGAFIVAFCKGRKININEALVAGRVLENIPMANLDSNLPLQFRIQVAASNTLLSVNELRKVYDGVENLEIIEEGGWYKYSIPAGPNYMDAWNIVKYMDVKGAFVVAYSYGNKIPIRDALKKIQ
jgi:hypothetical protein